MLVSERITPVHLNRQALIYVRQSSPHQTLTNPESLRLQYALEQRARDCGWAANAIEVIDCDLGLTGSTAQGRRGFQEVVTKVTLGQVGILFSYDVTRLSRHGSDWYSCSTCVVIARVSLATAIASMILPRPTAGSSSV